MPTGRSCIGFQLELREPSRQTEPASAFQFVDVKAVAKVAHPISRADAPLNLSLEVSRPVWRNLWPKMDEHGWHHQLHPR